MAKNRDREREGGGDKGMLGTKCSNPKPTSQRLTQGFHIVSVLGRGQLPQCDPAELSCCQDWNKKYQSTVGGVTDLNYLQLDVKTKSSER